MLTLALAGLFCLGVLVGLDQRPPWAPALLLALAGAAGSLLLRSLGRSPVPMVALTALLLGVARGGAVAPPPSLAAYHGPAPLEVRGVVMDEPSLAGGAYRFTLGAEALRRGDGQEWREAQGLVAVVARPSAAMAAHRDKPTIRYGDRLLLEGRLAAPTPQEGFEDYPEYLARRGVGSVMAFPRVELLEEGLGSPFLRGLYALRRRLARALERAVPEPEAALGQALLLGLRDRLPADMTERWRRAGLSHVLAISGLHVGILLYLSLPLSVRLMGRRRGLYLVPPLGLVWAYVLVAGAPPSAVRAAIMASAYLLALYLGRPRSLLPALALAAVAMVVARPGVLREVSFQLSFAAMAGIGLAAGPLSRALTDAAAPLLSRRPGPWAPVTVGILDSVAVTVAAVLFTLPLTALYFHRVSLVGVVGSLLVLPTLPLALAAHGAAALAGLVGGPPALALGWLAWLPSRYADLVAGALGGLPGAALDVGTVAPYAVALYYALLLAALLLLGRRHGAALRERARELSAARPLGAPVGYWAALLPMVAVAALLWVAALKAPDGRLHVSFLDVGQGDAIFIQTPRGHQIVVDGGPHPLEMVRYLGRRMPLGDRSLDLVVLTHPHDDHVAGLLEVVERYRVTMVLERPFPYDSPTYEAWRRAMEKTAARVLQARPGLAVTFDDGVTLQVLGPPDRLLAGTSSDVNNASVVLRLEYGDVTFLLTGDVAREGEALLLRRGAPLRAQVLKVAHHGSRGSSSPAFLQAVAPTVAVISVGEDNPFGHPHQETLENLARLLPSEDLFITKDVGTVEFVTDGRRLTVKTRR